MKKLLLVCLTMVLVLVGCAQSSSKYIKQEGIVVNQIEEKIKNKETFVYVVSSKTCSHCNALKKMLETYESDKTIYIFETTTASQADVRKLISRYPDLKSTPTTFFYKNGELQHTEVGYKKENITSKLDEFFK